MREIKIGHYTIRILEAGHNDFEFTVDTDNICIAYGVGETFEKTKENALVALEKELERIKIEAKNVRFEQFEKKPFRAFQWYPFHIHEDIGTLNGTEYFYKNMIINPGDWVLPLEGVVLTDTIFQKLFRKVMI